MVAASGGPSGRPPRARLAAGRPKAALRLAKEIVGAMYEGRMQPGQRYLPEGEALARLGVARASYREALRFLEIQGVVRVRAGPGGGPEIQRPGWPQLASTIALLLQFAEASLRVVLDARTVLEPGVARMAAARATVEDVATLAGDLAAMEAHVGHFRRFQTAYLSFWDHLAQSTHNPLLALLSPALRAIVNSAGFVPNEPYRLVLLAHLREVHEAVARHDEEGAAAVMTAIELEFLDRLTTGYPRQVERVVAWSDLDVEWQADGE